MPEWLVEEGIGEHRAILAENGAIVAARLDWPGALAAGQVEDAVLIARSAGAARGTLRFATDWAEYADWALERILASGRFDCTAQRADDWRTPPAERLIARYEQKGLGDCKPVFLDFRRL